MLSTRSLLPGNHKKNKETRQGIMIGLIGLKFVQKFQVAVVDKFKDLNPQRNSASPWPQGWWVDMKTTSLVRKHRSSCLHTDTRLQRLFFSFLYTSQLLWSCSCSFCSCCSFVLIIKVLPFQSLFSLRHCIVQTSALSILPWYVSLVLNSSNDCSFYILNINLYIFPVYGLVYWLFN